jgi:hypothetical protein
VSFATIGALWLGHNAITDYLDRTDTTCCGSTFCCCS